MSEFTIYLKELCEKYGLSFTEEMYLQMEKYYDKLLVTNAQYNLTTIIQPRAAAEKHFFDSIVPYAKIPQGARVVDIGSGAGFPVAPLKIVRPDIEATAVEASKKKCDFINEASKAANIKIRVIDMRAESAQGIEFRESFDVCVSRAVGQLNMLMELCTPMIKTGGLFFAYKANFEQELQQAKTAQDILHLELVEIVKMPIEEYNHNTLIFKKTAPTPEQYPRNYGKIKKSPL